MVSTLQTQLHMVDICDCQIHVAAVKVFKLQSETLHTRFQAFYSLLPNLSLVSSVHCSPILGFPFHLQCSLFGLQLTPNPIPENFSDPITLLLASRCQI